MFYTKSNEIVFQIIVYSYLFLIVSPSFCVAMMSSSMEQQLQYEGYCITDAICDLPKEKKISLCEKVFTFLQEDYDEPILIFINKAAFYTPTLDCEKKLIHVDGSQTALMYPCYGRSEITRTSFAEDNFVDKYYLSAGHLCDSVFLYERVNVNGMDTYFLFDYFRNVQILILTDFTITADEVTEELALTDYVVSTTNVYDMESTYTREIIHNEDLISDAICDLPKEKKLSLCSFIFDSETYNDLGINLNYAVFEGYTPKCENKIIHFHLLYHYNTSPVMQKMFPCYGQHKPIEKDIFSDSYVKYVHVSTGSRLDSVFVYIPVDSADDSTPTTYEFFEFIENLRIDLVPDTTIEKNIAQKPYKIPVKGEWKSIFPRVQKTKSEDEEENDEDLSEFYDRLNDVWDLNDSEESTEPKNNPQEISGTSGSKEIEEETLEDHGDEKDKQTTRKTTDLSRLTESSRQQEHDDKKDKHVAE